jgi:hypothetical protein
MLEATERLDINLKIYRLRRIDVQLQEAECPGRKVVVN